MKIKNIFLIITILLFANFNAFSQSIDDEFTIGEEGNSLYYYVTSVNPNEVEIYNDSFEGEELIIPNIVTYEGIEYNVTSIGEEAFMNIESIVSLVIPENIRQIGTSAFNGCTNLENITINSTQITTIPGYCFYKCPISSISLPNNITTIGDYAFSETNLTEITLPNSVTSIGDYAFANCTKLKSISLQNNITKIGKYAFSNTNLSVIVLPNSVTSIDEQAFSSNTNLTEITLSSSIESIGASTFSKCKELVTIRCNSITPPELGSNALGNTMGTNKINADLRIYIPAISTSDYLNAGGNWSKYTDRIVGAPTFITDGYWNEASNWSSKAVPASDTSVYINAVAIIQPSDIITVNNFGICDNGSILIKEGGQLIHQSGSGMVTIEKSIKAYEIGYDNYLESGWYTISSPFSNFTIPNSMTSGYYELYRYDETEYEWENHKNASNNFNTLESGRGYIYANSADTELSISGILNTEDKTYQLTAEGEFLTGFHLVGNPFMHNITKGVNGNLYNANLATGYYTLTNHGGWVAKSDDEPIAPSQGLLIQTTAAGELNINKNAVFNTRSANNETIAINVKNAKYNDVTYVTFNNGISLDKIKHRNGKIPMIYIPMDNDIYAIAVMKNDITEFPVAFEAMTMGEYTLSISANKNKYSEITLIDLQENRSVDLLKEEYNFFATTNEKPNRFIVKLSPRTEAIIYSNDNNIIIDNIKGNGIIEVYDIAGHVITDFHSKTANCQLSTESMTNGVYIIRLTDDNGSKVQKIMLNH